MATTTTQNLNLIEQAIQRNRKFTIPDIAGLTGLSTFDSKRGVESLMKKFNCRLEVTDQGELIYDFGGLVRKGQKTWREWATELGALFWKGFTWFFKVWIMLMLVGYFVVFVLILLAVAIAAMRGDDRGRGSNMGAGAFALILRVMTEFFFWSTITGRIRYQKDRNGYRYREYEPAPSEVFHPKEDRKKKKFIISVFDFVFGPKRAEIHPLENQREVATYIRDKKGILTVQEVRALAGWKGDQADAFFTEMVSNYEGELHVSDNGVIYADFSRFLSGKIEEQSTDIVFYWDEFEPEYKLNGNTAERNAVIALMNLFVLVMSFVVLNGQFDQSAAIATASTGFFIALGWIPFIYSVLFFLIPAGRYLTNRSKSRQRRLNNIRKRLMKAIYLDWRPQIPLEHLGKALAADEISEKVDVECIQQLMSDEVEDWRGELIVDENAALLYDFSRLREAQRESERLRSQRRRGISTGKTVFDTEKGDLKPDD